MSGLWHVEWSDGLVEDVELESPTQLLACETGRLRVTDAYLIEPYRSDPPIIPQPTVFVAGSTIPCLMCLSEVERFVMYESDAPTTPPSAPGSFVAGAEPMMPELGLAQALCHIRLDVVLEMARMGGDR